MDLTFDSLGMHLGNLSQLSNAVTRSISAENFTGAKGQGGMATEGHRRGRGPRTRPGLESLAEHRHRGQRPRHPGRHRGPGRDPAHLADGAPDPLAPPGAARLLGRRGDALHRNPAGRLLLQRLVRAQQCEFTAYRRQSRRAASTATWRCPSAQHARITVENLSPDPIRGFYYQITYTLTDCAGRPRLLPRAVAAQQSAAVADRYTRCWTAYAARGTTSARTSPGA